MSLRFKSFDVDELRLRSQIKDEQSEAFHRLMLENRQALDTLHAAARVAKVQRHVEQVERQAAIDRWKQKFRELILHEEVTRTTTTRAALESCRSLYLQFHEKRNKLEVPRTSKKARTFPPGSINALIHATIKRSMQQKEDAELIREYGFVPVAKSNHGNETNDTRRAPSPDMHTYPHGNSSAPLVVGLDESYNHGPSSPVTHVRRIRDLQRQYHDFSLHNNSPQKRSLQEPTSQNEPSSSRIAPASTLHQTLDAYLLQAVLLLQRVGRGFSLRRGPSPCDTTDLADRTENEGEESAKIAETKQHRAAPKLSSGKLQRQKQSIQKFLIQVMPEASRSLGSSHHTRSSADAANIYMKPQSQFPALSAVSQWSSNKSAQHHSTNEATNHSALRRNASPTRAVTHHQQTRHASSPLQHSGGNGRPVTVPPDNASLNHSASSFGFGATPNDSTILRPSSTSTSSCAADSSGFVQKHSHSRPTTQQHLRDHSGSGQHESVQRSPHRRNTVWEIRKKLAQADEDRKSRLEAMDLATRNAQREQDRRMLAVVEQERITRLKTKQRLTAIREQSSLEHERNRHLARKEDRQQAEDRAQRMLMAEVEHAKLHLHLRKVYQKESHAVALRKTLKEVPRTAELAPLDPELQLGRVLREEHFQRERETHDDYEEL